MTSIMKPVIMASRFMLSRMKCRTHIGTRRDDIPRIMRMVLVREVMTLERWEGVYRILSSSCGGVSLRTSYWKFSRKLPSGDLGRENGDIRSFAVRIDLWFVLIFALGFLSNLLAILSISYVCAGRQVFTWE